MKTSAGALTSDQIAEIRNDIGVGNVLAHPDTGCTFDQAVARLPNARREGHIFGSALAGADGSVDAQGRTITKTAASLAARWHSGTKDHGTEWTGYEFNPGGGPDFVCSSFEAVPALAGAGLNASPQCFVFEGDALRMQTTLQYGSHQTYFVGNLDAAGVIINAPGGTTTTPIARFGRAAADIAQMRLGDLVSIGGDTFFMTGANQGAGTLTIEATPQYGGPSSGTATYTKTFAAAVQFHRYAVSRTVNPAAFTIGSAGPFAMATPIPSQIVPGCSIMVGPATGGNFNPVGHIRIKSIDRTGAQHTFTLERPLTQAPYGSVSHILFAPTIWSTQIVSKDTVGPIDCGIYAEELVLTLPDAEVTDPAGGVFSGTDVTNWLAAHPKAAKLGGAWFAAWKNVSDIAADGTVAFMQNNRTLVRRDELDKPFELFARMDQGGVNVWTGNVHQRGVRRKPSDNTLEWGYLPDDGELTAALAQITASITDEASRYAFTEWLGNYVAAHRVRVLNDQRTGWRLSGSRWIDPEFGDPNWTGKNNGGVLRGVGVHQLVLPAAFRIARGTRVRAQTIWTRDWSICYIDGEPICITWWNIRDQEQPYNLILDVIMNNLKDWAWGAGFFCRDTANIAEIWMKVHEINIWRA